MDLDPDVLTAPAASSPQSTFNSEVVDEGGRRFGKVLSSSSDRLLTSKQQSDGPGIDQAAHHLRSHILHFLNFPSMKGGG